MQIGITPFTREDIKACFSDGSYTDVSFLEDCVWCLAYDDATFQKEANIQMVLLGPILCVRTVCFLYAHLSLLCLTLANDYYSKFSIQRSLGSVRQTKNSIRISL